MLGLIWQTINKSNDAQPEGGWSGDSKVVQSMVLGEVS